MNSLQSARPIRYLIFLIFLSLISPPHFHASQESYHTSSDADSENKTDDTSPWYKNIEAEWGGHLKFRGSISWVPEDTIFEPVGTGTFYDGNAEGRLNNRLHFEQWGYFDTQYKIVLQGGDTWQSAKELEQISPGLVDTAVLFIRPMSDETSLMDLSGIIKETDDYVLYHRIDRLALTLLPEWGVVRIGRQAVTWGNGLLFNPMDLFNPFSPADIDRDYKTGEDMVFTQVSTGPVGDVQAAYVPRRNPITDDVDWNESSLAGKLHFPYGTTEFDILAAHSFGDEVIGVGSTGYLKDAAWRIDGTWTFLDEESDNDDYLSLVANIDYSWVWWNRNLYGFLEYFFSGIGETDYSEAITDPDIVSRMARGELFTLGKNYLSGHIRIELHPLFNFTLTGIHNLDDPSGLIQPHATWDVKQNFQIIAGGNVFYGKSGTEFGGFPIPGADFQRKPADTAFLWFFYYF